MSTSTIRTMAKKVIPPLLRDAIWGYRKYDLWFALNVFRDAIDQPRLQREFERLNRDLPPDRLIIPPDLELKIIERLKYVYDLYCYKCMPFVREFQGFMTYAKGKRCLLDIGALFADYSLVFAQMNKGSTAYAVDPSPKVHEVIKSVMEVNPELDIRLMPYALGKTDGLLKMNFERLHCVDAASQIGDLTDLVEVKQMTIQQFVGSHDPMPDAVKMDAEGMELDILLGGRDYFSNQGPIIFLEIHPNYLANKGQSVPELVETLHGYGYDLYHYDGQRIKKPEKYLAESEGNDQHRIICSQKTLR
jgi:FkbM family methyltransferase